MQFTQHSICIVPKDRGQMLLFPVVLMDLYGIEPLAQLVAHALDAIDNVVQREGGAVEYGNAKYVVGV